MYDIPKYSWKCKETYCDVEISKERKGWISEGVGEEIVKSWRNEEDKDGEGMGGVMTRNGWSEIDREKGRITEGVN